MTLYLDINSERTTVHSEEHSDIDILTTAYLREPGFKIFIGKIGEAGMELRTESMEEAVEILARLEHSLNICRRGLLRNMIARYDAALQDVFSLPEELDQ